MHGDRDRSSTDPIPTIRDSASKVVVVDADFPVRLSSLERTVAFWRKVTWFAITSALLSLAAAFSFAYDRGGDDREGRLRLDYLERRADKAEARDEAQDRRLLDLERSGRRRTYDAPPAPSVVPSTHLPGDTL